MKQRKPPRLSETETTKLMLEFLQFSGCFCWRNNTGCMKSGGRFVHFGKAGSGDIIGIMPNGRFISVENKSNGEPVSDAQKKFAEEVKAHNGIAFFVTSLEDLVNQYQMEAVCQIREECF